MFFKNKKIKIIILLLFLPLLGLGCKGSDQISQEDIEEVTLNYWRVFDESDDFDDVIAKFRTFYPHININVRKLRFEEYESAILRAIASGNGPDIISVHNTWLNSYQDILSPAPGSFSLPTTQQDGRNTIITMQSFPGPSIRNLRNNFVDVVAGDAVIGEEIYGLPLSVDTLVLYYNRQLLNRSNIPEPPSTWIDFKDQVKAITTQDSNGNLVVSGAAMGTARNINRAPDILSALMLQNGTEMTNARGNRAIFDLVPETVTERDVSPGRDALRFYTDFASPAKEVYSWSEEMEESLQSFASQKTAFFFGYSYHLPIIKSLAPNLDLGITKLPQISEESRPINFANYWLESVTKQSRHPVEAWAFVQFASQADNVIDFLTSAGKPTALRTLISEQRSDDSLVNFVDQLLTAQSWYRGQDPAAMEEAFRIMIEEVLSGERSADDAIKDAARKVSETL